MSHDHCHSNSCGSSSHSHSHEGEGCGKCCDQHCHCECHKQGSCNYSAQLLALADEAWMELLKEKIKEEILKNSGDNLNETAKLVSDTNRERWKDKMAEKKCEASFQERLKALMCGNGNCKK